jgi:hypothetical protein
VGEPFIGCVFLLERVLAQSNLDSVECHASREEEPKGEPRRWFAALLLFFSFGLFFSFLEGAAGDE